MLLVKRSKLSYLRPEDKQNYYDSHSYLPQPSSQCSLEYRLHRLIFRKLYLKNATLRADANITYSSRQNAQCNKKIIGITLF